MTLISIPSRPNMTKEFVSNTREVLKVRIHSLEMVPGYILQSTSLSTRKDSNPVSLSTPSTPVQVDRPPFFYGLHNRTFSSVFSFVLVTKSSSLLTNPWFCPTLVPTDSFVHSTLTLH